MKDAMKRFNELVELADRLTDCRYDTLSVNGLVHAILSRHQKYLELGIRIKELAIELGLWRN